MADELLWWENHAGLKSCPECDGFGTADDDEETECSTCDGNGVALLHRAQAYLEDTSS